jgi:hypothetical protein
MGWRNLHNERLRKPFSSPDIITMINSRSMGGAGQVAHMEKRTPYKGLIVILERKTLPGKPRRR